MTETQDAASGPTGDAPLHGVAAADQHCPHFDAGDLGSVRVGTCCRCGLKAFSWGFGFYCWPPAAPR